MPKTSQPSIAKLDEILTSLKRTKDYTHVWAFLEFQVFYQNIQYMMKNRGLTIAFLNTFSTRVPLVSWLKVSLIGETRAMILPLFRIKLAIQISHTSAFIMVDDLDHLVKDGRLSNEFYFGQSAKH